MVKLSGKNPISGLRIVLPALLIALAVQGCAKGKGDVTGKVTFNGQALEGGFVQIMDSDGVVYVSEKIGPDGLYSVKNVATGEAKINVTYSDPAEVERMNQAAGRGGEKDGRSTKGSKSRSPAGGEKKSKGILFPKEYADFEKSGITVNVEKRTTKDIVLP